MNEHTDDDAPPQTPAENRLDQILARDETAIQNAAVPRAQEAILTELRKPATGGTPDLDAIGKNVAVLEEAGSKAFDPLMGAVRAGKERAAEAVALITGAMGRVFERETNRDKITALGNQTIQKLF